MKPGTWNAHSFRQGLALCLRSQQDAEEAQEIDTADHRRSYGQTSGHGPRLIRKVSRQGSQSCGSGGGQKTSPVVADSTTRGPKSCRVELGEVNGVSGKGTQRCETQAEGQKNCDLDRVAPLPRQVLMRT